MHLLSIGVTSPLHSSWRCAGHLSVMACSRQLSLCCIMGACRSTVSMLMSTFPQQSLPSESKPSCKRERHFGDLFVRRGGCAIHRVRPSLEPFRTTRSKCEGTFDTAIHFCR